MNNIALKGDWKWMHALNEWPNRLINQTYFCYWTKGAMGQKFQRSILSQETLKKKKNLNRGLWQIEGADQRRNRIHRKAQLMEENLKIEDCVRWVKVRFRQMWRRTQTMVHSMPLVRVASISGIPASLWCDEWRHDVASSLLWEWGLCHLFCTQGSFPWFSKDLSSLEAGSSVYRGKSGNSPGSGCFHNWIPNSWVNSLLETFFFFFEHLHCARPCCRHGILWWTKHAK